MAKHPVKPTVMNDYNQPLKQGYKQNIINKDRWK